MVKTAIIFISLAMLTSSCGNKRSQILLQGTRCPRHYNPISVEKNIEGVQKVSLDPEDKQLTEGFYEYDGSEIFYHDTKKDIKIHIQEGLGPKGAFFSRNLCVRGLEPDMEVMMTAYGINSMTVDSEGKVDFSTRRFQVEFKKGLLIHDFSQFNDEEKTNVPSSFYQSKASEFDFYQVENQKFELRSVNILDSSVHQYLLIRYNLKEKRASSN